MQDLQQLLNQLSDYIKGIWIKKRYIMICSWLICPPGFYYIAGLQDYYNSSARVHVDTRSVLQPLLRGLAIQTNPDQEIQMMVRTLLTPENAEKIARASDMDLQATNATQFESISESLKNRIKLSGTGRNNIYNISFQDKDPVLAQRVVQETLNLFVEGALGNNRRNNDKAEQFIDNEIAEYENRLTESEQRLADFKRNYSDILPLQGTFYGALEREKGSLATTNLEIRQTQSQIDALSARLNKTRDSIVAGNRDNTSIPTRYDDRIKSLEQKLDELKLRFTDQHPEVIETKELLDSLEQSREKELNSLISDSSDNQVPLNSLSRDLSLEMSKLESTLASLNVKRDDVKRKIAELTSKIDLVPQIEAESTALNRDYGILKKKYEALLGRKESAELSKRAELSGEDIQFKVLEPPKQASKPAGPNRVGMYTVVLLLGFGSGLGLAFLVSQITPILFRASQLKLITDYPIWGTVAHLNLKQVKKQNRIRFFIFAMTSGLLIAVYLALVTADLMNIKLLQGMV